jgi:hypothetical protein
LDTAGFEGDVGVFQGPMKTQFGIHLLEVTERAWGATGAGSGHGD